MFNFLRRKKVEEPRQQHCLGFHRWIYGDFVIGERSKFTGDPIGRSERHCRRCPVKEISTSQYSKENREELIKQYGYFNYLRFEDGDKLDKLTRKWLSK